METKPELTPMLRALIVAAVGRREFARNEYNRDGTDKQARELRRAGDALENADYTEALLSEVERLEKLLINAPAGERKAEMREEFQRMEQEVEQRRNASPWE